MYFQKFIWIGIFLVLSTMSLRMIDLYEMSDKNLSTLSVTDKGTAYMLLKKELKSLERQYEHEQSEVLDFGIENFKFKIEKAKKFSEDVQKLSWIFEMTFGWNNLVLYRYMTTQNYEF